MLYKYTKFRKKNLFKLVEEERFLEFNTDAWKTTVSHLSKMQLTATHVMHFNFQSAAELTDISSSIGALQLSERALLRVEQLRNETILSTSTV